MADYLSKPSQFRLPVWAQEFLAEESATTGETKTDIVLEALDVLKTRRLEARLREAYEAMAEENRAQAADWDVTLADGLGPEEW